MSTDTTTPQEIASIARDYLATELKIDAAEIGPADVLKELPGADSIKLLRVVSKLERHWDVEFADEDIFSASTVDELATLVGKYLDGAS